MDDLIVDRYFVGFLAFAFCIAVPVILEFLKCGKLNSILRFFGKISLELYVIHVLLYSTVLKLSRHRRIAVIYKNAEVSFIRRHFCCFGNSRQAVQYCL